MVQVLFRRGHREVYERALFTPGLMVVDKIDASLWYFEGADHTDRWLLSGLGPLA